MRSLTVLFVALLAFAPARALADTEPPAPFNALEPADGAVTNQAMLHFSWQTATDAESGIDHYQLRVSGQGPRNFPADVTQASIYVDEGPHTWTVAAVDGAGLERETPVRGFTLDSLAPGMPRILGPFGIVQTSQPTLSWEPTVQSPHQTLEDVVDYGVEIAGRPAVLTGGATTYTPTLPDGSYTWAVRAIDAAGNSSYSYEQTFVVDTRPGYLLPPSVSIDGGARFTNDPDVQLSIVWPQFATTMTIANDGGFAGAQAIPVQSQVPWHLEETGAERIPKTVYVRFGGGSAPAVPFTDDIILDQTAPAVRATAARTRRTVRLRVDARDRASGVSAMQITRRRSRPGKWRPYSRRLITLGSPRKPVYVRVRDGAGNRSRFVRAVKRS